MTVGRSPLATSSLGAVGGARGTAAGGLRILIEFLTQYDSGAVKQLQADLDSLDKQSDRIGAKQAAAAKAVETSERKANQLAAERKKLVSSLSTKPSTVNSELRQISNIGALSKLGQQRLKDLDKELGAHGRLVKIVTQEARLAGGINGQRKIAANLAIQAAEKEKEQLATQAKLSAFQNLKSSVLPRLGGLAVGALGGIFGGALIGVGFAAAQAALDAIEQSLDDLFDPARHARDAIKDLGDAINSLADSQDNAGDREAAAVEYLKSIGVAADEATIKLLAKYGLDVKVTDSLDKQKEIQTAKQHSDAIENQNLDEQTKLLIEQARARGDLHFELTRYNKAQGETVNLSGGVVDVTYYENLAKQQLVETEKNLNDAQKEAAESAYRQAEATKAQAAAAQLASFAQELLVNTIKSGADAQIGAYDSQIAAAGEVGPSAKTRSLQARLEKAQSGGGSGNSTELANIAQERALLLLKQKLRLMGTAIDLEKYEGKFLLAAIDAKLEALNKEAAAQDRLNKLLDLQYRAAQTLKRNQGESIGDFVERRAQENRSILSEQRDLERQAIEEHLNELKQKTEDEVALQELAERKKNALAKSGADARVKALQKELAASQKADSDATKAKIAELQKQKAAYEKLRDTAAEYATDTKNAQIREAISAANTITALQSLTGEISGLTAAKSFIQGLLASGAISGPQAKELQKALAGITSTLSQYTAKLHNVITHHAVGKGPLQYAEGGLIPLKNSSTPFGSNVRFGEEGTEYGLVLQHSIAKTLRNQGRVGQIGPFNVSRSDDMLRDNYMLKRVVKEAVREALS